MNEGTGGGRRRAGCRRASVLSTGLAGIALLAAACGGGSSTTTSAQAPYQQALAYAQCMRSHGEASFPDPTSEGVFNGIGNTDPNSPQYLSASKTCGHLLGGPEFAVTQLHSVTDQALKYVDCLRAHGVPDWPDPIVTVAGVTMTLHGTGLNFGTPQVMSAEQACKKLDTPAISGS
jgi:hypothetical protein